MLFLGFLLVVGALAAFNPCPLPGAVFAPPTNLNDDGNFQEILANLTDTLNKAIETGETQHDVLSPRDTAYSVSVFSIDDPDLLYEWNHTPPILRNASEGVREVDADSVYRIASISKLYTVYAILATIGDTYWDRRVTDFLPQLRGYAEANRGDIVDRTQWDLITLGQLAGQTSGLGRDFLQYTPGRVDFTPEDLEALGLPPLPPRNETIPCQFNETTHSCSTDDILRNMNTKLPVYSPNTIAAYSNPAYEILARAVETIVGKPWEQILNETLLEPLSLNRTFWATPDTSLGPIPVDRYTSLWDASRSPDLLDPAAGNYFTSTRELAAIGRSILASSLLDANITRAWLKPHAFTASLLGAVGLPWEIQRAPIYGQRVTDLYTKGGSLGAYTSNLVLLPDFGIGYTVLAASSNQGTEGPVTSTIGDILIPGIEEVARLQAENNFAGRFDVAIAEENGAANYTITLNTEAGLPGLGVTEFVMNGRDVLQAMGDGEGLQMRLYPTNLRQAAEINGRVRWAFRAIFETEPTFEDFGPFSACGSWYEPDGAPFGVHSLDEFLFTMGEEGQAASVEPRAWRVNLERVQSAGGTEL